MINSDLDIPIPVRIIVNSDSLKVYERLEIIIDGRCGTFLGSLSFPTFYEVLQHVFNNRPLKLLIQ